MERPVPSRRHGELRGAIPSAEERRGLTGDRGWLETGPVQLANIVELDVAGHRVETARTYQRLPALRSIGFDLPDVRLVLHGWDLSFDELEGYARILERLQLASGLYRSMGAAQARTTRRFDQLHGH